MAHGGRHRDARIGHVIARHLLVERLQRAGIDVLYRALQIPALLEVELAFAPAERDDEVHANLFRQALALGRLGGHPNITRLVLFDADASGTFLITESQGEARNLGELITPEGNEPLGGIAARLILEPLAAALGALARQQLVHGEIRPEHVLLHEEPGYDAIVQLGGFVRIPAESGPAPRFETFASVWRTPEQIFHHATGHTTDGYAVAAIAFALLFGRPPFPCDDRDTLLAAKRDAHYDPTEGLPRTTPSEVLDFFQSALAHDSSQRFDADGFRHMLGRALDALVREEIEPAAEPEPVLVRDDSPRRKRPLVEESVHELVEPRRDSEASSHHSASGTQQLNVGEIEELRTRPPRMHKNPR